MDLAAEKEPVTSEVVRMWKRQAEISEEFVDEWRDYIMLMTAFQTALERAPRTAEECAGMKIDLLLISELEQLADTVSAIFPLGGMREFASYVTDSPKQAQEEMVGEKKQELFSFLAASQDEVKMEGLMDSSANSDSTLDEFRGKT